MIRKSTKRCYYGRVCIKRREVNEFHIVKWNTTLWVRLLLKLRDLFKRNHMFHQYNVIGVSHHMSPQCYHGYVIWLQDEVAHNKVTLT